jgi:hypothetical protein
MKHLIVMLVTLLIPTATMARDECKADAQKFCKEVIDAKGNIRACLTQHRAELSAACNAKFEAAKK